MIAIAPVPSFSIQPMTSLEGWPVVDEMLREYVPWVMQGMESNYGIRFEDPEAEAEMHHAAFADEARQMLQGQGLLLLAHWQDRPVALVALKPVDAHAAEVKRLYVRPDARGRRIGRALMGRLVTEARERGYRSLRLETLSFMHQAMSIYKALGFREVSAFDNSQSAVSGVAHITRFMTLQL